MFGLWTVQCLYFDNKKHLGSKTFKRIPKQTGKFISTLIPVAIRKAGVVTLCLCGHVVFHFHITNANFFYWGICLTLFFSDNALLKANTGIFFFFPSAFLRKPQRFNTHKNMIWYINIINSFQRDFFVSKIPPEFCVWIFLFMFYFFLDYGFQFHIYCSLSVLGESTTFSFLNSVNSNNIFDFLLQNLKEKERKSSFKAAL